MVSFHVFFTSFHYNLHCFLHPSVTASGAAFIEPEGTGLTGSKLRSNNKHCRGYECKRRCRTSSFNIHGFHDWTWISFLSQEYISTRTGWLWIYCQCVWVRALWHQSAELQISCGGAVFVTCCRGERDVFSCKGSHTSYREITRAQSFNHLLDMQ